MYHAYLGQDQEHLRSQWVCPFLMKRTDLPQSRAASVHVYIHSWGSLPDRLLHESWNQRFLVIHPDFMLPLVAVLVSCIIWNYRHGASTPCLTCVWAVESNCHTPTVITVGFSRTGSKAALHPNLPSKIVVSSYRFVTYHAESRRKIECTPRC